MKLLDIVHPAAKTLVDIAKSQDAEVMIHQRWLEIVFTGHCWLFSLFYVAGNKIVGVDMSVDSLRSNNHKVYIV